MQGFSETLKLFQGFVQSKKVEKGCTRLYHDVFSLLFQDNLAVCFGSTK
jgi:hypothetical protein